LITADPMKTMIRAAASLMLVAVTGCAATSTAQPPTESSPRPVPDGETASPTEQTSPTEQSIPAVLGVFEGITPCSNGARPAPQIPLDVECEMMIWHLTLNQDAATGASTTYELRSTYGMSQPNTTGIKGGGTPLNLEGTWAIVEGTASSPDAVVYQLNPDDPEMSISFVKISDNLLHVLSPRQALMIGNGGFSYTLNRTDQRIAPDVPAEDVLTERLPAIRVIDPDGMVFDGRTACADVVYDFTQFPRSDDCLKIKWRLTLHQEVATGAPTTYLFMGTQTEHGGTWEAFRSGLYPGAFVYALTPVGSEQATYFLKPDDNHLYLLDTDLTLMVGDATWSYTFSKVP
jgi:hypothetical protein